MALRMICVRCHSENVTRDALVRWDYETQEWVLAGDPLDCATCEDCGDETHLEEFIEK